MEGGVICIILEKDLLTFLCRHFYATEHPDWLIEDLRIMFGKGGGAYGVVEEKDGYS